MSINTKMDEITVNDIVYDVDRNECNDHVELTIEEFPGLEGRLSYDDDHHPAMSPRSWCNVGTMAVSYRGYDLGDTDISEIDFEIECESCDGEGSIDVLGPVGERAASYGVEHPAYSCPKCDGNCYVEINPVDYFKQKCGARVVMGLTVYEHSGITMSAGDVTFPWDSDRWDTSFVGFIYDTPEGRKQCIGDDVSDEEIKAALESEVKVYAAYLEGDITMWSVEDDETGYMECVGGYVGDSDFCEEECFRAMESAIEKRLAEQGERAHWAARDTVTK